MPAAATLTAIPDPELAMAFGMAVQSRPGTTPPGALAAIADELARRSLLARLLAALGTDRSRVVGLAIAVDRTRARRAAPR